MPDELAPTTEELINTPDTETSADFENETVKPTEEVVKSDAGESDETIADEGSLAVDESPVLGAGIPEFRAGDTLRLGVRIVEGDKKRIQFFEGIVLSRKGMGISKTFTIRKIAVGGIAVERIFPLYSPILASFEVRRRGATRRAKVYFLRDIVGSTANVIKERKIARTDRLVKVKKQPKVAIPKVAKEDGQVKTTRAAKRSKTT